MGMFCSKEKSLENVISANYDFFGIFLKKIVFMFMHSCHVTSSINLSDYDYSLEVKPIVKYFFHVRFFENGIFLIMFHISLTT